MILYALGCASGHRFESWFRDSAAYDAQISLGLVVCPTCGSMQVAKTIMAPAVVAGRAVSLPTRDAPSREPATGQADAPPQTGAPAVDIALLDDKTRELRTILRGLHAKLVAEGDDVGTKFAVEARRIHDGEARVRQIYGQASAAEARDLLDDGIMILPMPIVPDELN